MLSCLSEHSGDAKIIIEVVSMFLFIVLVFDCLLMKGRIKMNGFYIVIFCWSWNHINYGTSIHTQNQSIFNITRVILPSTMVTVWSADDLPDPVGYSVKTASLGIAPTSIIIRCGITCCWKPLCSYGHGIEINLLVCLIHG